MALSWSQVNLNAGFDDREGNYNEPHFSPECLACENMDLMSSFHHYSSLMLMMMIHELLHAHMVIFKHMYIE